MAEDRKIKILCAEDEQEIRENIAEILRDEGFEVFEAENGKYAFESFMQNKPDIVVSDIMMPEVDGYALLHMIREAKNIRNNNVPFIFLTALGQKESVIKGVNLSANDYLVKPIDFDLMIAKIKEKTANALKIQDTHNRNIKNIKSQVSIVLPNELFAYLDIVTHVSEALQNEPYGPLPHRRYLEDINTIYLNALKLRSSITNSLDAGAIDKKLNSDEEVFAVTKFLDDFIAGLSEKIRARIEFEHPFDNMSVPRIKVDRLVLTEALRKIFAGMLKTDPESKIKISIMVDHFGQMIVIFYFLSKQKKVDFTNYLEEKQISKILDQQNCRFTVLEGTEPSTILTIPSYRLVDKI